MTRTSRREFLGSAATLGGMIALGLASGAFAGDEPRKGSSGAGTGGTAAGAPAGGVPGPHELPPLPYAYDALEPWIDAQTMQLHHDKHHAAYVKGLNAAEAAFAEAREKGDFERIAAAEQALAFHGSGHANHAIFWRNMAPKGKAKPAPGTELLAAVNRDFGSVENLVAQFSAAATRVEGNGWGALAWHPALGRLYTLGLMNHQNMGVIGAIPLLVCDVWEHAYYLTYQNKRADYVTAWWNVVDWADVEARFSAARKLAG